MESLPTPGSEADTRNWHALPVVEVAAILASSLDNGLDEAEAKARLTRFGPNRLAEARRRRPLQVLFEQYRNLLTAVLLAAAALAGTTGDLSDMVIILGVLLFNGLLGFHQEWQAEKVFQALQRLVAHHSRIRRNGTDRIISSEGLVPGDLVALEAGDRVPADGRLITVHHLEIDESVLTGESIPATKDVRPLTGPVALAERRNMAYMNTVVTRGRGVMLLTATGRSTEAGRVVTLLGTITLAPTPLQGRLDRLGKRLAVLAISVVAVYFALRLWQGEAASEVLMTSLALAVAAIPEGLPAVVSITLAIGMARMTRRGAVITRRAAIETLGCTTVICSDKTGTLTLNQAAVRNLFYLGRRFRVEDGGDRRPLVIAPEDGGLLPDLAPILTPAALCNDCRPETGGRPHDPTESALAKLAETAGQVIQGLPRVAEIPFDPDTRLMATFHRQRDGDVLVCVKGAPDTVLALCSHWLTGDGTRTLEPTDRDEISAEVGSMGEQALRVLAFAQGRVGAGAFRPDSLVSALMDLTFIGLTGLADPLRPEAADAIRGCQSAGIDVKIVTGDHPRTALALARQLGLEGGVLTGIELDAMGDGELARKIRGIAVFARMVPEHKLRLVTALRALGDVVAVTGDGVNDAPALKAADIGVAMGKTGSDVAREAAQMVLTDDNFATIVRAVQEGRGIYDRIVNFVRFQLSTNLGALLTVFAAPFLGLPAPFHPIHILWANIIMDGPPAMALAFERPDPRVMDAPPRPSNEELLPWMALCRLFAYGLIIAAGTLAVFASSLAEGPDEVHARTMAFTTFVLFQFFNLFNARAGRRTGFTLGHGKLWLALGVVVALQVMAVSWGPARRLFHTAELDLAEWAIAFAVAASLTGLDELWKFWFKPRRGNERASRGVGRH